MPSACLIQRILSSGNRPLDSTANDGWVLLRSGALSESQRHLFADELRPDAPHMATTERNRQIADETCGQETNLVTQARRLLDSVAEHADHYSKDPSKPTCGIGDAGNCMTNGGGCCADLHSLFIALARARGIPAPAANGISTAAQKRRRRRTADSHRCQPSFKFAIGDKRDSAASATL
jgi:transglutaminase-like putative cysteine protease